MFQPSLFGNVGFGPSTSSAGDSRVRTSARPGEGRALRAAARVYGERCSGLSAKSDPLGFSLRTYLCCACEGLTGLSLRWNESATPAGHWWLVLRRSEPRTNGTGCGSWPTIRSSDAIHGGMTQQGNGRGAESLTSLAAKRWPTVHGNQGNNGPMGTELGNAVMQNWETPTKSGNPAKSKRAKEIEKSTPSLLEQVQNWQTPSASCSEAGATSRSGDRKGELLLGGQARQWPTPDANAFQDGESPETWLARRERLKQTANNGNGCGTPLAMAVQLPENWTTPTRHDGQHGPQSQKRADDPAHLGRCLQYDVLGPPDPASPNTTGRPRGPSRYGGYIHLFGLSCARLVRRWWNSRERRMRSRKEWKPLPTLSSDSLWGPWVSQLMGLQNEYAAALTRACCEYWATHGSTRSPRSSSGG